MADYDYSSGIFSRDSSLSNLSPQPVLGEGAGEDEWGDLPRAARSFLHTESYRTFTESDKLFLYGARGTGKTTALRMLNYEVRDDKHSQYFSSWSVDQTRQFNSLAAKVRESVPNGSTAEKCEFAKSLWRWVFEVAAMYGTLWQLEMRSAQHHLKKDVATICGYLRQAGLPEPGGLADGDFADTIEAIASQVAQSQIEGAVPKYAALALAIKKALFSTSFRDAQKALRSVIRDSGKAAVVLLDSLDEYSTHDEDWRSVLAGAVNAALELYSQHRDKTAPTKGGILVKIAFPSEIFPALPVTNAGKVHPKSVAVSWSYSDLTTMLAKKHAAAYQDRTAAGTTARSIKRQQDARDYLRDHAFHGTTKISIGLEIDTLSYLIRHTQKKPRQLLTLCNTIFTLAKKRGEIHPAEPVSPQTVKDGVAARIQLLSTSAIQTGQYVENKRENEEWEILSKILEDSVRGTRCHFSQGELAEHMKRVSHRRKKLGMQAAELRELLITIGIVGVRRRSSRIGEVEVWECAFQYQTPGTRLAPKPDDVLVIHPMFYEHLETRFSRRVYVHPIPTGDAEPSLT